MPEISIKIDESILSLIPDSYALENKIVPLQFEEGQLQIAMSDPENFPIIQELMLMTNCNIHPVQMNESEILQRIAVYYKIKPQRINGKVQVKEFKAVDKLHESYSERSEITDDVSVINHINDIITKAINTGASDIHFEPYEKHQCSN
jgi:type IV pilus assembly protein PilB